MNKIKLLYALLLFTPALALAQSAGQNYVKTETAYDLRGWLTKISTRTFTEELFYTDGPGSKYCNGNISSIRWKDNTSSSKRGYKFTYDTANRLTSGVYGEDDALGSNTNRYSESMSYDANGNIISLKRYGKTSSGYGLMDNLTIAYTGNQPTSVSESASDNNVSGAMEYKKANGSGYKFNANGSLVADKSRGIAYITYDFNNNPKQIYFTNGSVTKYVYSASGQKLRAVHFTAKPNITRTWGVKPAELTMAQILQADSTDYLLGGRLTMKNGKVDKYIFDGGYAQASATDFQPYKYNGKELDKMHGLNTYDYGARQHDPILARWDRIDPMCEKNPDVTPYHFCHNYPVNRVDFDGKWDVNVHLAKDRTINGYGVAVVSDKNGQEIFKFIVRAEGVKGHDRTKIGADTPLGTYDIPDNNAWTNGKSRLAYGPNDRLIMNPESGEVVEYGRSDIRIHGDRQEIKNQDGTWQRKEKVELKKTYGCLRASDNDMKTFKAFTDYLESTDNQEKPGKVFINDDLERYNKNKNE